MMAAEKSASSTTIQPSYMDIDAYAPLEPEERPIDPPVAYLNEEWPSAEPPVSSSVRAFSATCHDDSQVPSLTLNFEDKASRLLFYGC